MSHNQMKVNPFQVQNIMNNVSEIPDSLHMIEAPRMWELSNQGEGVVVAVIDTGCDVNHKDLQGAIIGGRNFTTDYGGDPTNYTDNNGHGTHVAGVIGARGGNGGVVGVAPKCSLLIYKVLTGNGNGEYSWIIEAIDSAIKWRGPNNECVRVINLSLGGPYDFPQLKEVILKAILNNIIVCVASGNEGDDDEETHERAFPGSYNEVVEIGAITLDRRLAPFTNMNDEVDVVAPGVDIVSTYPNNKYAKLSGTSMATPHVSGALALIINHAEREFNRKITESEMYAQLIKRTIPLGYRKSSEGNGMVSLHMMDRVLDLIEYIHNSY